MAVVMTCCAAPVGRARPRRGWPVVGLGAAAGEDDFGADWRGSARRPGGARLPAAAWRPVRNGGCWTRYHTLDRDTTPPSPELPERQVWWRCGRNRNAALVSHFTNDARPILTLTTDFGLSDHYVGTMKGVILGICPAGADRGHQPRGDALRDRRRRLPDRAGIALFSEEDGACGGGGPGRGHGAPADSGGGRRAVFRGAGQRRALHGLPAREAQGAA